VTPSWNELVQPPAVLPLMNSNKKDLMQNLYPKASWHNPTQHLLFDIGYSYALLVRVENYLIGLRPFLEPGGELDDLLAQLKSFRENRIQVVNEIYEAAEEAAKSCETTTTE
jgi:hypothetical protein